tara:strand:+ start:624 stop:1340 length:717 start_codon:yes stop_codon:yes gene_type:complete
MSGYIGTLPIPLATQQHNSIIATSGQTAFTCEPHEAGFEIVWLNGVKLKSGLDYSTDGTVITLATGAALNDILEVVAFTAFNVANVATAAQGTTADSAVQPGDSLDAGDLINALPAISGEALTSLNSASLSGALPAIDGSALTGVGASTTWGAVGTYAYAQTTNIVYSITAGSTTRSGSSIRPHAVTTYTNTASYTGNHHWPSPGTAPGSGTWQAMGGMNGAWGGGTKWTSTLWVRIS